MNNIQSYKKAIIKLDDEEVVREYNVQKDAEDLEKNQGCRDRTFISWN